jgi:CDP-2,3-bis-(O-geranylgeranyl)-sn-glycerol synthase
MHPLAIAQLLILLTLANGSPLVARLVFRKRFSAPLDGGAKFVDGRPLLGPSKTIRGLLTAIVMATAGAPLLGLDLKIGLLAGAAAMAGDLLSSFVKRRLGLAASSRATGLDQIPESLIPALACWQAMALTALDVLAVCLIFFVGEVVLARLLFRLRLRERPY